ncbi:hypothetical protein F2P56_014581, partial [Juglans regia]
MMIDADAIVVVSFNIHVELQVSLLPLLDFISHRVDVLEIRPDDSALVRSSELQHEASAILSLDLVAVTPGYYRAEKVVVDGLVGVETENDVVWLLAGDQIGEIGVVEGRQGVKVKGNLPIKLILLHAFIKFGYFEELVYMEAIFDPSPPFLHDVNQSCLEQKHPNHHEKTNNRNPKKNQVSKNH